jgi:fructokinase
MTSWASGCCALHGEGVATDGVSRLDAPTMLSLVGPDDKGMPTYAFHGHRCADRLLPIDALALV